MPDQLIDPSLLAPTTPQARGRVAGSQPSYRKSVSPLYAHTFVESDTQERQEHDARDRESELARNKNKTIYVKWFSKVCASNS